MKDRVDEIYNQLFGKLSHPIGDMKIEVSKTLILGMYYCVHSILKERRNLMTINVSKDHILVHCKILDLSLSVGKLVADLGSIGLIGNDTADLLISLKNACKENEDPRKETYVLGFNYRFKEFMFGYFDYNTGTLKSFCLNVNKQNVIAENEMVEAEFLLAVRTIKNYLFQLYISSNTDCPIPNLTMSLAFQIGDLLNILNKGEFNKILFSRRFIKLNESKNSTDCIVVKWETLFETNSILDAYVCYNSHKGVVEYCISDGLHGYILDDLTLVVLHLSPQRHMELLFLEELIKSWWRDSDDRKYYNSSSQLECYIFADDYMKKKYLEKHLPPHTTDTNKVYWKIMNTLSKEKLRKVDLVEKLSDSINRNTISECLKDLVKADVVNTERSVGKTVYYTNDNFYLKRK